MTQEQAVELWNQNLTVTKSTHGGVLYKEKSQFHKTLKEYNVNYYTPNSERLIASFLRQWADALEGK